MGAHQDVLGCPDKHNWVCSQQTSTAMGDSGFVLGEELQNERMRFFQIAVLVFLTRKSSAMKSLIAHQGLSYSSSFFQSDGITFIV